MFSLGALGFLQPLFLIGLAALPLLWLLLRATPPRPKRVAFPGVRVLLGLDDRERTPQRTPLWLLLLRMAAAALLLFAFAEPLLNPKARTVSAGPLLIVMDGGWASAPDWSARRGAAEDALTQAAEQGRPTALVSLAAAGAPLERLSFGDADALKDRLSALEPSPWRPDPTRLMKAVAASGDAGFETLWLHDGLEALRPRTAGGESPGLDPKAQLAEALAAKGPLTLLGPAIPAKALHKPSIRGGALTVEVVRALGGAEETLRVGAFGGDPNAGPARRVGSAEAALAADALSAEAEIELPVQLRNTLERLQIDGARHAGAVSLLDDRFRRRRIALVSGEQERAGLPLLSGMHFLRAALSPHAAARETSLRAAMGLPEDAVGAAAFGAESEAAAPLAGWADAIVLADVGRIDPETEEALVEWVRKGGLLVRFAGPKLAALAIERERDSRRRRAGAHAELDPLLPVRLRGGGRALGGALSWTKPQALAAFPPDSPFAGLVASEEVSVARQVLAQPSAESTESVWARLKDGTPLVTARDEGEGRVVLFHVTAHSSWSTLPLAGLFADMMGRLVAEAPALSGAFGDVSAREPGDASKSKEGAGDADAANSGSAAAEAAPRPLDGAGGSSSSIDNAAAPAAVGSAPEALASLWRPIARLDGYGGLSAADSAAAPVPGERLAAAARLGASAGIAPGIYERAGGEARAGGRAGERAARIAVNALGPETALAPFVGAPAAARMTTLSETEEIALKPALLAFAVTLLALDALAALFIAGRLRAPRPAAASLLLALALSLVAGGERAAFAQGRAEAPPDASSNAAPNASSDLIIDPAERRAALETVIGYVKTGDARVDEVSMAGLTGLQRVLTRRTALEPGAPGGVDLEKDELGVYAILYWPITSRQRDLTDGAVRRLNAFMRTGGLLVVDTQDANRTFSDGDGPNAAHLRRLLTKLDLPPIEPASRDHVINRTFYLLDGAPGRWRSADVWVASGSSARISESGSAESDGDVNDGVSPIVIGSVDWIGAWAEDDRGRPLFPQGRGGDRRREQALRFGINLAMYAYTGNYKSDQVHIDALLERLDN